MPASSIDYQFSTWGTNFNNPSYGLVVNACLFTNALDMNEWDAPVSNKTNAINELSGNIPITALGSFITSSTLGWFTYPF
jgi:hypothetical protein